MFSIKNANKITIEHLLYHRSGIHNFTDDKDYLTWNTEAKTEQEMVALIAEKGIDFETDSKAQYSNSIYVLLNYILERNFHKTYADLLNEYIVDPLGLAHTYFGDSSNMHAEKCTSYRYEGSWQAIEATHSSIPLVAGGIVSTPTDLVKFSAALFVGKLLTNELLETMKSLKDGFTSVFSYFADDHIAYALTSNGNNYNNNNISIALLSAVYDKPYTIPVFSKVEISAEDLNQYFGVYVSSKMPLKIAVTQNQNGLMAQATGQAAFPLDAVEFNKFKFDQAGIVMEFNPSENSMLLKQGGGEYLFKKE